MGERVEGMTMMRPCDEETGAVSYRGDYYWICQAPPATCDYGFDCFLPGQHIVG